MNNKLEFNTLLSALTEEALANNNILDKKYIDDQFKKIDIESSKMNNIYEYFKSKKIDITGLEASKNSPILEASFGIDENFDISNESNDFLNMYYKDLDSINDFSTIDIIKTLKKYLNNDKKSNELLVNSHLHLVKDKINSYTNLNVSVPDLIGGGNLGLLEGISSFHDNYSKDFSSLSDQQLYTAFLSHIKNAIDTSISQVLDEENFSKNVSEHLAQRANMLDKASRELAKKINKQPSLAELAKYVSLPEEEVENILKYSIDAMTINVDIPD